MQNVEDMEVLLAPDLKVVAQGIPAQPIEILTSTHKTIERFARVGQGLGLERADGLNGVQLDQGIEFFELSQGLSGKSNLKHSRSMWASL